MAAAQKVLQDAIAELQTFRAALQSDYFLADPATGVAVQTQSDVPIYLKSGWEGGFGFSTDFTQIIAIPRPQRPRRPMY